MRKPFNRTSRNAASSLAWLVRCELRKHGSLGVRPKTLARILGLDPTDVRLTLRYLVEVGAAAYVFSTGAYRATSGKGWAHFLGLNDFYPPTVAQIEAAYKNQLQLLEWSRRNGLAHHAQLAKEAVPA